ncbi:hypothetical protein WDU94_003985 [Cyamophila willieti]
MSNERMEWVEIIEPKTQEHMYANLRTGECVWDPPIGVHIKKRDDNQWWELFDHNTSRFYYYNATTQKTVWHRPSNCDIIPLAKLQTLKQHAEAIPSSDTEDPTHAPTPTPRETVATQTSTSDKNHTTSNDSHSIKTNHVSNKSGAREREREDRAPPPSHRPLLHNKNMVTCQTQTSPLSPRRSHHHTHHHHHHHNSKDSKGGTRRGSGTKPVQSQDSGRSSDSNCSSSVHRTPSSALSTPDTPSSISLSTSTPLLKKKPLGDAGSNIPTPAPRAIQRSSSNAAASSIPKQKSFDHNISIGGGYSLGHENRCGSMSRTPKPSHNKPSSGTTTSISRSQSFAQGGAPPSHHRDREFHHSSRGERPLQHTRGGEEEDSMHEKYFMGGGGGGKKSVESTPQTRRKHLSQLSSIQPPTNHTHTPSTPDYVNFSTPPPPSSYHSRSSSNSSTMQTNSSHPHPHPPSNKSTPPSINSVTSYPPVSGYQKSPSISNNKLSSRLKESGLSSSDDDDRSSSLSLSSSPPTAATPPRRITNTKPNLHVPIHLSDTNLDLSIPNSRPPSSDLRSHPSSDRVSSSSKHNNNDTSISRHNNNDRSPLYTNTSLASNDEHLLPLHQYILEQAKLSGCYRFGEPVTAEEGGRFKGSKRGGGGGSEDEDLLGGVGGLRVEYDSDEFADDEAMSNAEEDSSSQEYLDDEPSEYLHEEYARRFHAAPGSTVWNYSSPAGDGGGGRVCDYRVECVDDGSGASSHYYNTTASLLPPHRMGGTNHHIPTGPLGVPQETQHASLKRKKDPLPLQTHMYPPILEARSEQQMQRVPPWQPPSRDQLDMGRFTPLPVQECDVGYAPDNLNIHKKGLFRKNLSVKDMLSWSVDPISQPMTVLQDKTLKKEARDLFKLVQIYMGDRKTKVGTQSLNSVALEICTLGYTKPQLRDELYIQICKQTSENPKRESLRRGWELMAICLAFFPPSPRLQSYLDGYMNRHRNPNYDFPEVGKWPIHIQVSHYATVACKRLERGGVGGKRQPRKPSVDEIEQARLQIFRPSMFGGTLAEVMALQRDRFPHHRLPWIQTTLSEQVLRLGGQQTEGIFRVSADMDEVTCLKLTLDRWDLPQSPPLDAHTPASLLKLWYRELYEPLIPDSLYGECVTHCESPCIVLSLVDKLPELNRLVLCYLVHFLQMFAKPDVVQMTKMDANNLAMVMAPNCLRCTSSDPCVIFDNARKEMAFMRTLIQHLDTRFIQDEQVF